MNIAFIVIMAIGLVSLAVIIPFPIKRRRQSNTAAYDDFIQRSPGFVVMNGEVLLAIIEAIEPEKADWAAWERSFSHDSQ